MSGTEEGFNFSEFKANFPADNVNVRLVCEKVDQQIESNFHKYGPQLILKQLQLPETHIWLVKRAVVVARAGSDRNFGLFIVEKQGEPVFYELRRILPYEAARFLRIPLDGENLRPPFTRIQLSEKLPQPALQALFDRR